MLRKISNQMRWRSLPFGGIANRIRTTFLSESVSGCSSRPVLGGHTRIPPLCIAIAMPFHALVYARQNA